MRTGVFIIDSEYAGVIAVEDHRFTVLTATLVVHTRWPELPITFQQTANDVT